MRDRLIHDYFSVDYHMVRDVATNKLPELKRKIVEIMKQESGDWGAGLREAIVRVHDVAEMVDVVKVANTVGKDYHFVI